MLALIKYFVTKITFSGLISKRDFTELRREMFFCYINLDSISRLLTLKQPNMIWTVDALYLIPTESYRYFLYAGWILLFAALFLFYVEKKKGKKLISVGILAVCVICFSQVFEAGSFQNFDNNTDNIANDYSTFAGEETSEETADFSVTAYDMKISVGKQLSAEVTMTLDQPMKTCRFTLYRGYKIREILDENGNPLNYERDLDYLTVQSEQGISQITIYYSGCSGTFYSNRKAVCLPGYFAWYPQPGHRPVYQTVVADSYMSYGYNLDVSMFSESRFHIVTKNMPGIAYSNLENKTDDFVFDGTAKTCTLMSGPVEEIRQNDVRMIIPELKRMYAESSPDESVREEAENCAAVLKERLFAYTQYLGLDTEEYLNFDKVFVVDGTFQMAMNYNGCYMEDYVFIDSLYDMDGIASELILSKMNLKGFRQQLLYEVLEHLQGHELSEVLSEEEYLNWEQEDDMIEGPVSGMYATLLQRYDAELVDQKIMEYLTGDNDMDCITFMKALYVELASAY